MRWFVVESRPWVIICLYTMSTFRLRARTPQLLRTRQIHQFALNMNRFPQVLLCLLLVLGLLGSSQAQKAYATCGPGLECVPRHLCDSDNIIIKNGQPVINFRTGKPPSSTTVCDWTEICCFIQRKVGKQSATQSIKCA